MSHTTTSSQKPSLRATWRLGDTVVNRENAGWTTLKNRHPRLCQNFSQGPAAEKTGRGSLLNRYPCLSPPPDHSIVQGAGLNSAEPLTLQHIRKETHRSRLDNVMEVRDALIFTIRQWFPWLHSRQTSTLVSSSWD